MSVRNNNKAVVILSGGLDSTTLLYDLLNQGWIVNAFTIDYGQRHRDEIRMARKTCNLLSVPHKIIYLPRLKELDTHSSQTSDNPVPEGHYADETMKGTVVHNRNMILIALATAYALDVGAGSLFYGAHAGDHAIYPDCRPEFVTAMQGALEICDYQPIDLITPYLYKTKVWIVRTGMALGVDYSLTLTCYNGTSPACGKCGSCNERLEAFKEAGVKDPIPYESDM